MAQLIQLPDGDAAPLFASGLLEEALWAYTNDIGALFERILDALNHTPEDSLPPLELDHLRAEVRGLIADFTEGRL